MVPDESDRGASSEELQSAGHGLFDLLDLDAGEEETVEADSVIDGEKSTEMVRSSRRTSRVRQAEIGVIIGRKLQETVSNKASPYNLDGRQLKMNTKTACTIEQMSSSMDEGIVVERR